MKYPDRNATKPDPDPYPHRCCGISDDGDRCHRAGTMTQSIVGSDRWFCYRHFRPFAGLRHPDVDPQLHPYAKGTDYFAKRGDGRDWAREIIALNDRGEYHSAYGLQLAREALGLEPYRV